MRRADDRVVVHKAVVVVSLFLVLTLWVCLGSTPCPAIDEPGAPRSESDSQALPPAASLLDARIERADSFVRLDILADGTIGKYTLFVLSDPTRLVLDLAGPMSNLAQEQLDCDTMLLRRVRVGEHPDYLRFVLESPQSEFPPYKIAAHGHALTIFVGTGFKSELAALDSNGASFPEALAPATEEAMVSAAGSGIAADESMPERSEAISVPVAESPGEEAVLALSAALPEPPVQNDSGVSAEEPADVEQAPPVSAAAAVELAEAGSDAGAVPISVSSPGAGIAVVADPAASVQEPGEPAAAAGPQVAAAEPEQEIEAALAQQAAPTPVAPAETAPEAGAVATGQSVEPEVLPQEEPEQYLGERISLDFKDADIKNILRLIAEVSGLNVVAGDDVEGTVTIRLTDVPWDQALEVILLSNGLGMDLKGNILRVAPIDTLNREREKVLEGKKKAEKLEPLKKGLVPVSYASVTDLKSVITSSKLLSPRGSIQFDKRTNTMVVIDIEKNIREINKLINELDTPTPQVLIESRIIQINPTYTKELGVTWSSGYTTTANGSIIGVGGNEGVEIDGDTGTVTTNGTIVDLAPPAGAGVGGAISFGFLNNNFALFAKIAALEKDEKLEIVSSPRIMTLDNQEAVIEQGVDLPYLKLSEEGVTSTEFKKATLALTVTPHITSDGSVQMEVEVKKDQRSAQTGAGDEPGIDTRRAETNVLVRSGNTVVIGGIYEETKADSHNSVPFFGRLPLLGFLFKGTSTKRDKTELVVFITPTIVTIEKTPLEEAIWISDADQKK